MPKNPASVLIALALLLAACAAEETYPLSGEECAPGDPVRSMSAADCMPPA